MMSIAIACALSGIAATLMAMGTTFHRRFGAPINADEDSCSNLELDSDEAKIIRQAAIIIIDEVSMMKYTLLDMLDNFLKKLMGNDQFMGGKVVILLHDFRQILPVVKGGARAQIVSSAVINSNVWKHFTTLKLNRNMRVERLIQQNTSQERIDQLKDYSKWLLAIGDGKEPSAHQNTNSVP